MACSGGSIICQCLAAMPGVAMLSEIHPDMGMLARANPLKQAQRAYGLISEQELAAHFVEQIRTIHANAQQRSMILLLRDHLHADFIAPGHYESRCAGVLGESMPMVRAASVRHPIDVWLGLQHNGWLEWTIPQYCARLVHVARCAREVGFVQYEEFTLDPGATLEKLCALLEIPFDAEFQNRLDSVSHITGASGRQSLAIEPRPRRQCDEATLDTFEACPTYHEALDTLGYQHPDAYEHLTAKQTAS
jgi:hypothetical protein